MDILWICGMIFHVTKPSNTNGFVTWNGMSLSKQESEFLALLSAQGRSIFTFQDAHKFWGTPEAATNSLGRLVRKRWLFRLENGLYMIIPLEAGPEREWSENSLIIASHLVSPGAVAYWSAMRFWNMTEQLPHVQFIQTTKRKRSVSIQGISYRFITVSEKRFFGTVSKQIESQSITVTDLEKTLIDAADRPDLSGGIIQLAEAMSAVSDQIDWEKLTDDLEKWGGGAVAKRLGYLLERLALPIQNRELIVDKWRSMISKGISSLEPGSPKVGPTLVRWQLQINVPGLLPKGN
jgi:predicted transcriptional regulator of viral defense system